MTKRTEAKHKIDRRMGENIWGRPKSPVNKREYGPGQHGQRRKGKLSDFGIQLKAKQKLKGYYANISERQFHGIPGFSSRVRALTLNQDGYLAGIETVMQSPTGFHDNLEGIAAWADAQGRLRLTMISDDNFLPWQRGEIVEYSLPVPKSPAPAG